ncbi:MAG: bifunctional hydroxymethylpyrimidine kinase/phosphomethylpyrimidine kinase [Candidatus Melainabacteria bacterium]|nr:bifunctional hydroxymethylpyrimidine kinase/phosphomethylpyrimidine kinase [Candidatus Melainabacteria bacterium]
MKKLDKKELAGMIKKLSSGSVLVVGDIILDEFIVGSPERISREAPVIILEHMSSEYALGGASNAAHNISALGAKCYLAGIVGEDLYSKALETECLKNNIHPVLTFDKTRPTTVKTRLLSTAHRHPTSSIIFKQQLIRLDRLSREAISSKTEEALIKKIEDNIEKVKIILISDYNLGVCTKKLITHTIKIANENKIPVLVDAGGDFQRFKNSFLITPNQPDTESAVGFSITDNKSLIKAGEKLLKISDSENILITRGSEGMALFNKSNPENPFILTAFNVSEVFDVTGAGDTVAGIIACAMSIKSSLESACTIGNLAASIVVRKYGTAVTGIKELEEHLKSIGIEHD